MPDPGFPIYESMARFAGATPVPIPLRQERDFRIDIDELRELVTERTRLIVINSPHNPCGSILTPEDLEAIAVIAMERDLIVLADEIYSRIQYDGDFHSIASLPGMAERTIVLDGFSKTYSMTGWRLGYAIVPPELVPVFSRLIINSVSCTSSFSQLAAVEALTGPQDAVDAMVQEFRARRTLVVDGLERAARRHLPDAPRGVLRLPGCQRYRHERPAARGAAAAGGGRERPVGHRVRERRARPHPGVVRELPGEHLAGLGADGPAARRDGRRVSERPRVLVTRRIPEAGLRLLR